MAPIFSGLLMIIITIPLLFAAVQPWMWTLYAALIIVLYIFHTWGETKHSPAPAGSGNRRMFLFSAGLFYAYALLQCLPLPASLLGMLSPYRRHLLDSSEQLLNQPAAFQSISYVPAASFSWWIFLLSLWLFFLLLKGRLTRREHLMTLVVAICGISLIQALYGLMQALVPTMGVLWVDYITVYLGDARGTFINRNHFAGFIEMTWPMWLALIFIMGPDGGMSSGRDKTYSSRFKTYLSSHRSGYLFFCIIGLLFVLLALLFSRSRAGIAGGLVGGVSFVILAHLGGRRFSGLTWGLIGAGMIFLAIYGNAIGFDKMMGRLVYIDESAGNRMDIWKNTIDIARDHPLGTGLRTFESVMPAYNTLGPVNIKYKHAHNDYLELLAETGWIGFMALTVGFYLFLGQSILRIKRFGPSLPALPFFTGIGACSGLISMAFHGFFDFNLQIPANCIYFIVLITILYVCLRQWPDQGAAAGARINKEKMTVS
ncbi:MAG: O-antigen ligase domain-containing protein [Desulfobacteraceae bacterium]|jgi:O-antigen ligase|nr:MAG: O-antigen ligase domain-containing protein [Desulfobacteraceae bacterium]